jgi:hypothetical protein
MMPRGRIVMKVRKGLIVVAFALAIAGVGVRAETADRALVSKFGESMNPELELTPIAAIVADPNAWVTKRVRVAGEISGVCTRRGCWIDLRSEDGAEIRIKVDDGVVVFPLEAQGHRAEAEGEVEILEMDRAKYEAWRRHAALEEGREFDPAEVGEGPYRVVRLRGVGAEIEGL